MPELNERNIFLVDGVGAATSALFLSVVLVAFQEFIGMPHGVLYTLAAWASLYAVYSLACYRFANHRNPRWLRRVMRGNLVYCCATILCVIHFSGELLVLGHAYFLAEMAVIVGLVWIERGVLRKLPVAAG